LRNRELACGAWQQSKQKQAQQRKRLALKVLVII
jgi:hypothetical protein